MKLEKGKSKVSKTMSVQAKSTSKAGRRALTPEAREQQLVNKALNLAEQQLEDGTASSQVITHFLKIGAIKAQIELEKLKLENDLTRAKTESLNASKQSEAKFNEVLEAMRRYTGTGGL